MKLYWGLTLFILIFSQDLKAKSCLSYFETAEKVYENQYAQHFEIKKKSNLILVQALNHGYRIIYRHHNDLPQECHGKGIAAVDSVVPTSTSMLHFFTLLQKEDVVTGFPGTRYISSPSLRKKVESGLIEDLGDSFSLESLILLAPDLILTQGEYSVSATGLERYQKLVDKNFAFLEFKENHPLARAEWVVVLAALLGEIDRGISVFKNIRDNYQKTQTAVEKSSQTRKVLVGAFYQGRWFSPAPGSDFLQLLKDAGAEMIGPASKMGVNFEDVLLNSKQADLWLPQASWQSLEQARSIDERHLMIFDKFKDSQIFALKKRSQGLEFWEKGVARPDLVLRDLAQVLGHLPRNELVFYTPLKNMGVKE